ncbi:heat- and acid-stable phosphoprotein [Chamberlinius hualienensis]
MPRGAGGGGRGYKGGHKGQKRHFTNPDDLVAEQEKQAREKQWRQRRGEDSDDSEEEDASKDSSSSDSESSPSGDEASGKAKGVEGMIEVENPNRVITKTKKISQLDTAIEAKPELSRKEREEIEKQRARDNYLKMHAAGKTDDARADLARLAIIKQQRELAAKKRDEEIKAREVAAKTKADSLNKALGKNKKT